ASLSRTMEMDVDPHCIADTATDSHDSASLDSQPSLPTPNPPAPPPGVVVASPNGAVTPRPHRSAVWDHFAKADNYETFTKAPCMHWNRMVMASGGSTSTMLQHLKNHHLDMLTGAAASPDKWVSVLSSCRAQRSSARLPILGP